MIRLILTVLGAALALAGIVAGLWFLFEVACRRHGWWPQLFAPYPPFPTNHGGSREG